MSDNPMHAGHRPPVRMGRPGDLLFSFRDAKHRQIDCELRDHDPYGVEAQFLIDREFYLSRRFETRALAEQCARSSASTSRMATTENPHLADVFDTMLPALDREGLRYWVYGGVGVAGAVGKFFRINRDVDIYVNGEEPFGRAQHVLSSLCESRRPWHIRQFQRLPNGRPKFELWIGAGIEDERLSVVPVYETPNGIEYKGAKPPITFTSTALVQETRNLGAFTFPTPPSDVLKAILWSLLHERPKLLERGKRRDDAQHLFTAEEFAALATSVARVPRSK